MGLIRPEGPGGSLQNIHHGFSICSGGGPAHDQEPRPSGCEGHLGEVKTKMICGEPQRPSLDLVVIGPPDRSRRRAKYICPCPSTACQRIGRAEESVKDQHSSLKSSSIESDNQQKTVNTQQRVNSQQHQQQQNPTTTRKTPPITEPPPPTTTSNN